VISRRRFLLLLGTATTGVWLASTGLVRLERRFVMALAGSCSFCGKRRTETKMLVGTFGRPWRICDECVQLCCEIIAEELTMESLPPATCLDSSARDEHIAEMLRCLIEETDEFRKQGLLGDVRHALHSEASHIDEFRCSFCDAHRRDVRKLIAGPRVFICGECVVDATAVVGHVLRA
jgi:hypothetical protein